MNLKLLRAEARAMRRASVRAMHNGLSLIGLVVVVAGTWTAFHQETVKGWVGHLLPTPARPAEPAVDAFANALGDASGEATRLLGLGRTDADQPVLVRASAPSASDTRTREQIAKYLAKKYRVNLDAIELLVDAAYAAGKDLQMDPVLLLSVMAIESGFNPFAESTAGASGLMQLMAKVHETKLADYGGPNIALNPIANLRVGAIVLKDCIARGGSVAEGLRLYVGAGNGSDNGYGARVLQEKDRLLQAVRGVERPRAEPIPSQVKAIRKRPAAPADATDDEAPTHATEAKAEPDRIASL